jgi:hypothetical protein
MTPAPIIVSRANFRSWYQNSVAAGHDDESRRILDEHNLAHEKVLEFDELVEIGVRFLFLGQPNVAAEAQPAGLMRAAVGGLHQARTAARHDGVSGPCERSAHVAGEGVVRVVFVEPGRAEYGDAGGVEIETLEAAQELEEYPHDAFEIGLAAAPAAEEGLLGPFDLSEEGSVFLWIAMFSHGRPPCATSDVALPAIILNPTAGQGNRELRGRTAVQFVAQALKSRATSSFATPEWSAASH